VLVLAAFGFLAVLAMDVTNESAATLASPGGWWMAIGRVLAFSGTYLMLMMVVLTSRLPALERALGQDRLVRWHRTIGGWPIVLIALHIVTITIGYGQSLKTGALHQFVTFLAHYPDLLMALAGFSLLLLAGFSSYRAVRRRLRYETWWAIHLYLYLALGLSFAHQVKTGVVFLGHPLYRWFWTGLWLLAAGIVLFSRVVRPVLLNARLRLRVANVEAVSPGVYAVTVAGHGVNRLAVSGGQFFQWRFLAPGLFWHSHPYSLSAMPRPPFLRLTVKALGDQSGALAHLTPGTRVVVEGPYGTFTRHARRTDRVTLIGAGVGITPLRALIEDLPEGVRVDVVVRASSPEEIVHGEELTAYVERRGGQVHEVIGPRDQVRLDAKALRALVPDIARGDLFICGPVGFTQSMTRAAVTLGVPHERVHFESFAFH
jgi:predicted ferric reductase